MFTLFQIKGDDLAEKDEQFYVNLTSVILLPSDSEQGRSL